MYHLIWDLPESCQSVLSNSLQFNNKQLFFYIKNFPNLQIEFNLDADFDSLGPQKLKFQFVLKENGQKKYSTPQIQRTFKNKSNKFIQSLNIRFNQVFDQKTSKFSIEIFIEETEASTSQFTDVMKSHSNIANSESNNSISNKIDLQIQPPELIKSNSSKTDNVETPEHVFSSIKLKDENFKLDSLETIEQKQQIPPSNIQLDSKETPTAAPDSSQEKKDMKIENDWSKNLPFKPEKKNKEKKLSDLKFIKKSPAEDVKSPPKDSPHKIESHSEKMRMWKECWKVAPKEKESKSQEQALDSAVPLPLKYQSRSQPQTQTQPQLQQQSQSQTQSQTQTQQQSQSQLRSQPQTQTQLQSQPQTQLRSQSQPISQNNEQETKEVSLSQTDEKTSLPFKSRLVSQSQPTFSSRASLFPGKSQSQSNPQKEYCGLFNQGATCYMNSMLQAFYHLPAFRRLIYRMDTNFSSSDSESKPIPISKNIPLQLQKLFAKMQTTEGSACSTRDLTRSFGWTDSDTIMQHDVQEFCRVIIDNLETKIDKQEQLKGSIQALFRGKMRSYIRCTNVKYESKRDEYFYDLSLDVKGCRNLKESFFKYTEKEKLFGKNQYDTGDPKLGKQDAEMGNEFIEFPPVLYLHLRRFEFNGSGMSKINSRFEFPHEINLIKFMAKDGIDRDQQTFELFGVLVHSGTADGGHYYAFLRPTEQEKWYEFNDSSVSVSSPRDAIENNYGGSSNDNSKIYGFMNRTNFMNRSMFMNRGEMQHQRMFSAYMLVYIRKKDIPILYERVTDDEIPQEIIQLIAEQEEMKRKKEEEKKIKENTITFNIYLFKDIGENISKTNKLCFPNLYDLSIGKKFTALRGEKLSILYQKVLEELNKENENDIQYDFDLWPIYNNSIGNLPLSREKSVEFPSKQNIFLCFNDSQPKANLVSPYPYIIVFVFLYVPPRKNSLVPIEAVKVEKTAPVNVLFEILEKRGYHYKSLFKGVQMQSVTEITNYESTFEENQIRNGTFLVFDSLIESDENNSFVDQIDSKSTIFKYNNFYKPDSIVDYFNIICNLLMFKIKVVESDTEYKVYFPGNRIFSEFLYFIKFIFKIPEMKTILFYKANAKKPIKIDSNDNAKEFWSSDLFNLFQFDQISTNVFDHSLHISFRIVGSLVKIFENPFSCWMNEDSTIADLLNYASTFITQLKIDFTNPFNSQCVPIHKIQNINDIRKRVVSDYGKFGTNLNVFSMKMDNLILHPQDEKLSEIDWNPILYVDIEAENRFILNDLHIKNGDSDEADSPKSSLLHLNVTEKAMCYIVKSNFHGNTLINVFEGETLATIKKRLAFFLNKDENYFFEKNQNTFTFSLFMKNNAFNRVALTKDDELILPYIQKDFVRLKVDLSAHAAFKAKMAAMNSSSSSSSISRSDSMSYSISRDDSLVIKN